MKKCSWCGKEWPDSASQCADDFQPLIVVKTEEAATLTSGSGCEGGSGGSTTQPPTAPEFKLTIHRVGAALTAFATAALFMYIALTAGSRIPKSYAKWDMRDGTTLTLNASATEIKDGIAAWGRADFDDARVMHGNGDSVKIGRAGGSALSSFSELCSPQYVDEYGGVWSSGVFAADLTDEQKRAQHDAIISTRRRFNAIILAVAAVSFAAGLIPLGAFRSLKRRRARSSAP